VLSSDCSSRTCLGIDALTASVSVWFSSLVLRRLGWFGTNIGSSPYSVNDSCVLERGLGDIADELFLGFAATGAPGLQSTYRQFTFAKSAVKSGIPPTIPSGAGDDEGGDNTESLGMLEVLFATAVPVPRAHDCGFSTFPEDTASSARVTMAPSDVAAVHEVAFAKDGHTLGVAGGKLTEVNRNYTPDGVCYGEDLPNLNVVLRLRERWWLEAKGVIAREDGQMVQDQVGDPGFALRCDHAEMATDESTPKKPRIRDQIDLEWESAPGSDIVAPLPLERNGADDSVPSPGATEELQGQSPDITHEALRGKKKLRSEPTRPAEGGQTLERTSF
jgi:hypothetical protein